jgi:hypothetical protein
MVTVVPIITGITFVFTFQMRCISIVRSLYFKLLLLLLSSTSSAAAAAARYPQRY